MINPANWSADYEKNIKKLQDEGYHYSTQEELPAHLQRIVGGESYLVNEKGEIKAVSQATGEIRDVPRTSPQKDFQGPRP